MAVSAKGSGYILSIGADTTLPLEVPASDTFTAVGNLSTITPPGWEQESETYYEHDSSAAKSIGGRFNAQEVPGTLNDNPTDAGQILMHTDKDVLGGQLRNYRVTFNNGRIQNFQGFLKSFVYQEAPAGEQGPAQIAFVISVSGAVTES